MNSLFKPWYAGIENPGTFRGEDLETLQITLIDDDSYNEKKV